MIWCQNLSIKGKHVTNVLGLFFNTLIAPILIIGYSKALAPSMAWRNPFLRRSFRFPNVETASLTASSISISDFEMRREFLDSKPLSEDDSPDYDSDADRECE